MQHPLENEGVRPQPVVWLCTIEGLTVDQWQNARARIKVLMQYSFTGDKPQVHAYSIRCAGMQMQSAPTPPLAEFWSDIEQVIEQTKEGEVGPSNFIAFFLANDAKTRVEAWRKSFQEKGFEVREVVSAFKT